MQDLNSFYFFLIFQRIKKISPKADKRSIILKEGCGMSYSKKSIYSKPSLNSEDQSHGHHHIGVLWVLWLLTMAYVILTV